MAKIRPSLHLLLAFALLSLTCDLCGACEMAAMETECCCDMEGRSPCMDLSDSDEAPGGPQQEAALGSTERFSVAVLEASALDVRRGAGPRLSGTGLLSAPEAAPTPLYLSHCAFLC